MLTKDDRTRLSAQCHRILELLQERGSAGVLNTELARIALKYTSRISDLRRAGHNVMAIREGDGVFRYVLMPKKRRPPPPPSRPTSVASELEQLDLFK